jgi:hypothetical protein
MNGTKIVDSSQQLSPKTVFVIVADTLSFLDSVPSLCLKILISKIEMFYYYNNVDN